MELSKALATQIVNAIYEVVNNDINLINSAGIIIGSTNTGRIGTFHAAGYQAIEKREPIIVDKQHIFEGARDGINYPIFLEDEPIAAIGITGKPEKLKQFGFLVTKITEVFLKEQQLNEEMLSENRSIHYLITALIYDNVPNQKQLEALLVKYHMDISKEYAVLSVTLPVSGLEQSLRFFFHSIGCQLSLYLYPNEWVVIFDQKNYRRFRPDEFAGQYEGKLHAGLGSFGSLYQLSRSYRNALIARKHAQSNNMVICSSDQVSLEFILESLPADGKALFSEHVLKALSEKDLQILKVYFSHDLSLKETAETLFIHKNTLQYQLDRISAKCGKNPRNFQDAFLLQLALHCHG